MATIDSCKLLEFLRKKQLIELGSGLYSSVYSAPKSDRVIKVCRGPHDSWPDYVIWATKNGYAGTLAPKIYSMHFIENGYVATMERLNPIDTNNDLGIKADQDWHDYCRQRRTNTVSKNNAGLHDFITKIREVFSGSHGSCAVNGLDLHPANVMVRNDGSLVITDPVTKSEYTEKLPRRMRTLDIAWTRNAKFQSEKSIRH